MKTELHETLALCNHGIPVKFGCMKCNFEETITKKVEELEHDIKMLESRIAETESDMNFVPTFDYINSQINRKLEKFVSAKRIHECIACDGTGFVTE
jgi:hypothetical protein